MFHFIKLCLLFFIISIITCSELPVAKVAIIGGGIGGASASHYLTELFDGDVDITLFEANELGGRLANVDVVNQTFDAGGAVIHPKNKYMKNFLDLLGLEKRPQDSKEQTGIWNGEKFVFTQSKWTISTLVQLVYRYGLQPFRLFRWVDTILNDFDNIYGLQDKGIGYENVKDLLSAMSKDFPEMTEISTKEYLQSLGYSDKIIEELVESTLVVNYGQDVNVHSFVGAVSIAGATDGLWSVRGGNCEIPQHLIRRNEKVQVSPSLVERISYLENDDSQYEVFYNCHTSDPSSLSAKFDIVILATPLTTDQKNRISFENFPEDADFRFDGYYQMTVATFSEGQLNPNYFNLEKPLGSIFSCNPNKTIISSVSKLDTVFGQTSEQKNQNSVWKVFSRNPLGPKFLKKIFKNVGETKEIKWKAYPHYGTENRNDRFKLYKSLYHINAIEWAASAMEMSAIGGRNVAILAYNDYLKKFSRNTEEKFAQPETKSTTNEL